MILEEHFVLIFWFRWMLWTLLLLVCKFIYYYTGLLVMVVNKGHVCSAQCILML